MQEELAARDYVRTGTGFGAALREVWRLLKQGIEFSTLSEPKLQNEMRALAAPHMPVLVHKRTKVGATTGPIEDEQWYGELGDFVSRMLWPYLQESPALNGRSKNCVAELLDEIVAAEQRRVCERAMADIMPRTSRFDTSWAM
ncbi:MAG: hypothetical protein JSR81_09200 [Proteobacteria bacterium]|nr:hypothetical protein [Pseudomonadota bacterium]